jgi:hypothetical protein
MFIHIRCNLDATKLDGMSAKHFFFVPIVGARRKLTCREAPRGTSHREAAAEVVLESLQLS